MQLIYFAHQGVEHANSAEAAAHQSRGELAMVLLISLVAALAIYGVTRWLSRPIKQTDKEEKS